MTNRQRPRIKTSHKLLPLVVGLVALHTVTAFAQTNAPQEAKEVAISPTAQVLPVPEWQTAAGGKMSFEVASVRQNKTGGKSSMNVDPTPFDSFTPTGGLYVARNVGLAEFVAFAYKLTNRQLASFESQVPWSLEDLFDIEARAEGNPTKDQYRLMMQSLLADRFKLVVHFETRDVPVYALVLAKPGKLGPQLRLHRVDDPACDPTPATPLPKPVNRQFAADNEGFPLAACGELVGMVSSAPGRLKWGGRDVPVARIAAIMTGVGVVDRPMVDETGIKGTVDYSLEWRLAAALKEQLGIKMVSKKGPMEFFVTDHVEHPSAN
ncbi:MAG: TIGR03435 family protein [Acidobacteriota bacterium]|nr:TIGR03435 family protein [Acidobacteriota bacterium]